MGDQDLFFEDRKGKINSKQRKRKLKSQEAKDVCNSGEMETTEELRKKHSKSLYHKGPNSYPRSVDKRNSLEYSKDNESYSPQNRGNLDYRKNSNSFQRKKYNKNDRDNNYGNYSNKNSDASEPPEKDKKLSELVSYYEKILQTLKTGLSKDETEIFVSNVLQETEGYEVKLSSHRFSSHCIELLLAVSNDPAISRQFMAAFALEKEEICTNANATHITELLLNIAVQNIQNWSSVLEQNEESAEKENVSYFISWISDLAEFVVENFCSCLQNQYACHVVCSVIRALGGDMSSATDSISKRSAEHKKEFRQQYTGDSTLEVKQHTASVVLESTPKFFCKFLKKMSKTLLTIEGIVDYVTDSSSATVIETLLCILKKRIPKRCKKLISGLATNVFSERNDNGIPKAFTHRNCSFVVEKMFEAADEELQQHLWNEYFTDSLESLVTHSVGNFIIQRLFDVVESKALFELMNEKVGTVFGKILSCRYYGLFISIAGACNRLKTQQAQFMKNIMHSLQCLEPEEKQIQLVSRLLGFQVSDQPKISICLQGSLLVQAILKFQKPIKVVNSVLNMKPQELGHLARHMQGCHVLNAFLSSSTVGEKSKDKLIQSLKPCIIDIASDRNGSLTLSRMWMLLTMKQKSSMAQILVQEEKTLNGNNNGNVLLKKCGIFYFKKNIEKWREIQNNLSQSRNFNKRM
ncbi:Nucleolar protein 9 [Araneus ventricosus]|uniref:Nucleolar protein 9 n=1 Tax=Araneus ventricosus TaxID=182803 RepID=A0A4Y2SMD2_ARAVE|nr:Nucleolar protein 9 [Araneus ventricosus]